MDSMNENRKQKKGKARYLWSIIFLCALGLFVYSGIQLGSIIIEYSAGVKEYDSVAEQAVTKLEVKEAIVPIEQKKDEEGILLAAEEPAYIPEVDFAALQEINPDIIGWLEVEAIDTIRYPIAQAEDNDYYLHHTVQGQNNGAGSIFIDYRNRSDFMDSNTIIYGHNMKNGSMFGKLKQFTSDKGKDMSRYIWVCTPEGKYRYEIFSVQYTGADSDTYTIYDAPCEEVVTYLNHMVKKSSVKYDVNNFTKEDRIISLSTCTSNDDVRLVVQARWIETYQ